MKVKGFEPDVFGALLPSKFQLTDKKLKEMKEVRVAFKILSKWNDQWPLAKIVNIEYDY